jgi:hypothetical protein
MGVNTFISVFYFFLVNLNEKIYCIIDIQRKHLFKDILLRRCFFPNRSSRLNFAQGRKIYKSARGYAAVCERTRFRVSIRPAVTYYAVDDSKNVFSAQSRVDLSIRDTPPHSAPKRNKR